VHLSERQMWVLQSNFLGRQAQFVPSDNSPHGQSRTCNLGASTAYARIANRLECRVPHRKPWLQFTLVLVRRVRITPGRKDLSLPRNWRDSDKIVNPAGVPACVTGAMARRILAVP
jgi:hypothetical protein